MSKPAQNANHLKSGYRSNNGAAIYPEKPRNAIQTWVTLSCFAVEMVNNRCADTLIRSGQLRH